MRHGRRQPPLPDSISIRPQRLRIALLVMLAGLAAAGAVCERTVRRPIAGDDQSRYHDRTFRVARIVDGDTIDIVAPDGNKQVTRVRLWGVDTPEVARGGKAGMHFGAEASAFAKRILDGRDVHVVLSPKRSRGKYGRLLAYVFLQRGGRMFNEMLLEEGYAYADLRFKHHYFKRFKTIEKRARRSGMGLWAGVTPERMPAWKRRFEHKAANSGG